MNVFSTAFLLALLLVTAGAAKADGGPYIGGSIGSATLTDDFEVFDVDDDSTAYRLVAGFNFGDTFGLEAGYQKFGRFEEGLNNRFRLDADGVFLGATLGLPLTDRVRLLGRGGFFFWDGDSIFNDVRRRNEDDGHLYLGAGAEVELTDTVSLIGDWTRYELDYTDSDVISIGFTVHF
jgi:hypothetical protein